jgi:hypothetical protein
VVESSLSTEAYLSSFKYWAGIIRSNYGKKVDSIAGLPQNTFFPCRKNEKLTLRLLFSLEAAQKTYELIAYRYVTDVA